MAARGIKAKVKRILCKIVLVCYKFRAHAKDAIKLTAFLFMGGLRASFFQRLFIVKKLYVISAAIHCPHTQHEVVSFIETILSLPQRVEGCIVEAGSYKGGSTAKFSIAAKMAKRHLVVFDSFEGIPEHHEPHHKNIFGYDAAFPPGSYSATLDEAKANVRKFGELGVCEFIKGWFGDTMPKFSRPVAAIYLDVDLASSTRTCLKYIYPLLTPGGSLYSQDGHLPLVIDVFNDDQFWKEEVGCAKPHIEGLGKQKLIKIVKPIQPHSN